MLATPRGLRKILHAFQIQTLGWWNGRHVRLRGVCRKACGFKSRPEHHLVVPKARHLLGHNARLVCSGVGGIRTLRSMSLPIAS